MLWLLALHIAALLLWCASLLYLLLAAPLEPRVLAHDAVLVLTLLVVGAGWCWRASRRGSGGEIFYWRVAAGVYMLTAAASLLIGAPVIALPPCL